MPRFLLALMFMLLLSGCGTEVTPTVAPTQTSRPAATDAPDTGSGGIPGVEIFKGTLTQNHPEGMVAYEQNPPLGGDHNADWQNCGVYDRPVRNEYAVHSLEHGAVWITYRPDLAAGDVEVLRGLTRGHSHVLLSPYPDLSAPVVASAWGIQLKLERADDPRLPRFIEAYENGPQNPEPGAPCSGAEGVPLEK